MFRRDGNTGDKLDIHHRNTSEQSTPPPDIDSDDSENTPLANQSPRKITVGTTFPKNVRSTMEQNQTVPKQVILRTQYQLIIQIKTTTLP